MTKQIRRIGENYSHANLLFLDRQGLRFFPLGLYYILGAAFNAGITAQTEVVAEILTVLGIGSLAFYFYIGRFYQLYFERSVTKAFQKITFAQVSQIFFFVYLFGIILIPFPISIGNLGFPFLLNTLLLFGIIVLLVLWAKNSLIKFEEGYFVPIWSIYFMLLIFGAGIPGITTGLVGPIPNSRGFSLDVLLCLMTAAVFIIGGIKNHYLYIRRFK